MEKFKSMLSPRDNKTSERNHESIKNRDAIRIAQDIALKMLDKLEELDWTQKELAEKMEVSQQYVSNLVKGKELNLGIVMLSKIEKILSIPIFSMHEELKLDQMSEQIHKIKRRLDKIEAQSNYLEGQYVATESTKSTKQTMFISYYKETGS